MANCLVAVQEPKMSVATHPTPDTLASFARGDLPAEELAAVAEHIGGCATCCAALSQVPDDTLGALAKAAGAAKTGAPGTVPNVAPGSVPVAGSSPGSIPPALAEHPRYAVIRELGAGGMGVVYKAEHRIMGRLVALKVMAPHLTAKSGAVERFRKEVRAAAQLNHPNIVTAHDADEAGGMHFLVMEYVEGTSLDRFVAKKGPLPVPMACNFIRKAALGLQHAHEKGMVHRDIKPQNMMVTRKAEVKVMDFGLARFVNNEEEMPTGGRLPFGAGKPVVDPVTNPNLLMGTPDYLSPEQARNSHNVDNRSDIYSLGCTLFFLLTAKPPFAHAGSLIDKLLAHTEEPPPSIRELRSDVPTGLASVLEKMMAKNPDDRYANAAEVAAAVLPYLRATPEADVVEAAVPASGVGIGGEATPAPVVRASPVFDTEPAAEGSTVEGSPRPRKKKSRKRVPPWWKRPGAVAGAAAIGLLVIIPIVAKKRDSATPPKNDTTNARPSASTPATGTPAKPSTGLPSRQPAGTNKKALPILFIVPSRGLYLPDYLPVRDRMQELGFTVVTASGQGGSAMSIPEPGNPPRPIPVELKLIDADAKDYSAVAVCGYDVEEYIQFVPGSGMSPLARTTRELLAKFQEQGKPIGAICTGVAVLARLPQFSGQSAAKSETMIQKYPYLFAKLFEPKMHKGLIWKDEKVVVDGKLVTAASSEEAHDFAEKLVDLVRKDD
jgi:serine/threonine-protein kinase